MTTSYTTYGCPVCAQQHPLGNVCSAIERMSRVWAREEIRAASEKQSAFADSLVENFKWQKTLAVHRAREEALSEAATAAETQWTGAIAASVIRSLKSRPEAAAPRQWAVPSVEKMDGVSDDDCTLAGSIARVISVREPPAPPESAARQQVDMAQDEAWCHAACLSIAEGAEPPFAYESLAMSSVLRVRRERDRLASELERVSKELAATKCEYDHQRTERAAADRRTEKMLDECATLRARLAAADAVLDEIAANVKPYADPSYNWFWSPKVPDLLSLLRRTGRLGSTGAGGKA